MKRKGSGPKWTIFPTRYWEQTPNGWVSRPLTKRDKEHRTAWCEQFNCLDLSRKEH